MEKTSKKSGVIITLVGLLALVACALIYFEKVNFITNSNEVSGIVQGTSTSGTGDSREYTVLISYKEANGNITTSKIKGSSNIQYLKKGEVVALRYIPNKPESFMIDSIWELWGTVIFLGFIGLAFFLSGFGVLIKTFKQ